MTSLPSKKGGESENGFVGFCWSRLGLGCVERGSGDSSLLKSTSLEKNRKRSASAEKWFVEAFVWLILAVFQQTDVRNIFFASKFSARSLVLLHAQFVTSY